MMQANWTNSAHWAAGHETPEPSSPPRVARPNPAGDGNKPSRRQPVWPLLVVAFGLAASVAWAGLLLWLILSR